MNKNLISSLTILEAIEKIFIYSREYQSYGDFLWANDQKDFNATANLLIAIGEEVKNIDPNLKERYFEISWTNIVGMRNIFSHNYRGIDAELVWNIIHSDLIELKNVFVRIVKELNIEAVLLESILNSEFYRHIRYLID
ncbi:MAG: DUF86 domain-containing protein [bacterium]